MSTPASLDEVARKTVEYLQAQIDRDAAIKAAHEAGFSLREICSAASCSHQTVKNILDRQ